MVAVALTENKNGNERTSECTFSAFERADLKVCSSTRPKMGAECSQSTLRPPKTAKPDRPKNPKIQLNVIPLLKIHSFFEWFKLDGAAPPRSLPPACRGPTPPGPLASPPHATFRCGAIPKKREPPITGGGRTIKNSIKFWICGGPGGVRFGQFSMRNRPFRSQNHVDRVYDFQMGAFKGQKRAFSGPSVAIFCWPAGPPNNKS